MFELLIGLHIVSFSLLRAWVLLLLFFVFDFVLFCFLVFFLVFLLGGGGVSPAKGEHTTLKWVRSNRLVIIFFAIECVIIPTDITHSEF